MRFILAASVAVLAFGLVDSRPASAAGWQCVGADYVCGGAATAKKKAAKHASAKPRAQRVASAKRAKSYSSSSASSASYSSGGSVGLASYYWQGQMTASGARFNPSAMTAAHRSLPFGTRVLVTHLGTGRTVTVTINDRGPFIKGRIIDLSSGAAGVLGMKGAGVARVQLAVLGRN